MLKIVTFILLVKCQKWAYSTYIIYNWWLKQHYGFLKSCQFLFRPLGRRLEAIKCIQKITEGLYGYKVIIKCGEEMNTWHVLIHVHVIKTSISNSSWHKDLGVDNLQYKWDETICKWMSLFQNLWSFICNICEKISFFQKKKKELIR